MKILSYLILLALTGGVLFFTSSCNSTKQTTTDKKYNLVDGGFVPTAKKGDDTEQKFFDALQAKAIGDYQTAENDFKEVIKADPKQDAANYELARLLESTGSATEAINYAKAAYQLDPTNMWYVGLYGKLLSENNQFKEAASLYEDLLAAHPDETDFYIDWAYALLKDNQPMKAIEVYNKLETKVGVTEELSLQKQHIYLSLNQFDKAVEETQKLIDAYPEEPRYYGMLAELYSANNQVDKAIEIYNQLLVKDPGNPYALLALADIYNLQGNHELYIANLKQGFVSNKMDIKDKMQYMVHYLSALPPDGTVNQEAYDLINILIDTDPESPDPHTVKGDMLLGEKKDNEALAEYKKAIKLNPDNFDVWKQVLGIEAQSDMTDSLLKNSADAIELFPNQATPYLFNGMANSMKKNYPVAEKVLKQGVPISMSNSEILTEFYSQLGDVYHSMKADTKSDSCYELALKLNPDNPYVLNNYSYYLSVRKQNLDRAKDMSLRSNQLVTHNSSFEDTYAWILYQLADYANAKTWQEKALADDPKQSATLLEHYGDILYQLGQVDDAVKNWKLAQDKGSDSPNLAKKIADRKLYD